jgi:hypothetical protein
VNTQSDISNKIIKCSQEDKLEILISLRAFLLGLEDCPWFIFFPNDDKSEIIKKSTKKNLQYYKKINESNLRKIQIKPIDIFLLPKNKKIRLIQILDPIILNFDCEVIFDKLRSSPFNDDDLLDFIMENIEDFNDEIIQVFDQRSLAKNKLLKEAKITKSKYSSSFSISRKNKIIDYWKNLWGMPEKYHAQSIVDQIIIK